MRSNTEPRRLGDIINDVANGKEPMPIVPVITPAATPEPAVKMTEKMLTEWLYSVNQGLRDVGRLPMTDGEIKGFTKRLLAKGYTLDHADCADHFLLFGKRINFTSHKILAEYFYPTPLEMQQFKVEFIPIAFAEAKVREAIRLEKQIQADQTAAHEREKRVLKDEISWLRMSGHATVEMTPETKILMNTMSEKLTSDLQEKKFERMVKQQQIEIKHLKAQNLALTLRLHEYEEDAQLIHSEEMENV